MGISLEDSRQITTIQRQKHVKHLIVPATCPQITKDKSNRPSQRGQLFRARTITITDADGGVIIRENIRRHPHPSNNQAIKPVVSKTLAWVSPTTAAHIGMYAK